MKYLIKIILVFISASFFTCFIYFTYFAYVAFFTHFDIDQNLIKGANRYEVAVENIQKTELQLSFAKKRPEYWLNRMNKTVFPSPSSARYFLNKINESNQLIRDLSVKYGEAREVVRKFEPMKKEYDRKRETEKRREDFKNTVLGTVEILGLPIVFFIAWLFAVRWIVRRNKRLVKDGKLTKWEYENMMLQMQNGQISIFNNIDDNRVNPSTGLPLIGIGISDAGGNVIGSSSDRYYR